MNPFLRYARDLIDTHKRFLLWPLNHLEWSHNRNVALFSHNFRMKLARKSIRFSYDEAKGLYFVSDSNRVHYFGNLMRGAGLYRQGLAFRSKRLWDSYLLNKIDFDRSDVVIDCGANYADLWLELEGKIDPENYITFEPGEDEFRAICQNAPGCNNNKLGLGNLNQINTFYVNDRDADSSIIEPSIYFKKIEIETVTLDSYVKKNGLGRIKLLKLEAEGFEPEILEGSTSALDQIEYVAIDGGFERGKEKDETFSLQTNFLLNNRFEMIAINLTSARALFRKLGRQSPSESNGPKEMLD